uniref:Protein kinase domain-containing protein n=1 Tax=Chromera velia CCMP2878 TaxID=1169474 RepID=A0A0G4GKP9_9ALVE|eukprot:Cvel_22342.t1-p1 / transcript=Cvel_22342.t1 / gene=Cvel_22342 / organism=Chromera_velia_CCMP2878 / gene_product=hypothetical protein / transcript_product=hypothetical protein / location=Cvel_scaffold2187:8950-10752(-) / protein_length=601 / sequence_SO=supercontig / SO=protein_coding / is_pseudo=false
MEDQGEGDGTQRERGQYESHQKATPVQHYDDARQRLSTSSPLPFPPCPSPSPSVSNMTVEDSSQACPAIAPSPQTPPLQVTEPDQGVTVRSSHLAGQNDSPASPKAPTSPVFNASSPLTGLPESRAVCKLEEIPASSHLTQSAQEDEGRLPQGASRQQPPGSLCVDASTSMADARPRPLATSPENQSIDGEMLQVFASVEAIFRRFLSGQDSMFCFRSASSPLEKALCKGLGSPILNRLKALCEGPLFCVSGLCFVPQEMVAMSKTLAVAGGRVGSREGAVVLKLRKGPAPQSTQTDAHKAAFNEAVREPLSSPNSLPSVVPPPTILSLPSTSFSAVVEEDGGATLGDLGAPLEGGALESFVSRLLHGVHCLHTTGHSHRDLKPGNVLATGQVFDFGSVRSVVSASQSVSLRCVEGRVGERWVVQRTFCLPEDAEKFFGVTEEFLPPRMLLVLEKLRGFPSPLCKEDPVLLKEGERLAEKSFCQLGGDKADAWACGLTILHAVMCQSLAGVLGIQGKSFDGRPWQQLSALRQAFHAAIDIPKSEQPVQEGSLQKAAPPIIEAFKNAGLNPKLAGLLDISCSRRLSVTEAWLLQRPKRKGKR